MRHHFLLFLILTLFLSCNRIRNRSALLADSAKSKSKKLLSKTSDNILPVSGPDSVSIKDFVPAFKKSRSVKEIKGVQFDIFMRYVNFFVYEANRKGVLKSVSSIVPEKTSDILSDSFCTPITAYEVLQMAGPGEHNEHTEFFWHFRQLRKIEAFRCVKGHWGHFIIFDSNSDTVYHKIEELKD